MLERGSVRVGTLHEYRDEERFEGKTSDANEGSRQILVQGPRSIDGSESQVLGIQLMCPGRLEVDGSMAVSLDWPDCNIYCLSGAFFTSTLRQSLADGKKACVAILDTRSFFAALSEQSSLGQLLLVDQCRYGPRNIEIPQNQSLMEVAGAAIPPVLLKPEEYSDQREVRAVWQNRDGPVAASVVDLASVTSSLLPVSFSDVDVTAVLEGKEELVVGARIKRESGKDGLFSIRVPGQIFTLVCAEVEGQRQLAFAPQSHRGQFVGAHFENVAWGMNFSDAGALHAGTPLADITAVEYFSRRVP